VQIDLFCIGRIKEPYLREGITEYLTRLSGFAQIRISDYPEERISATGNASDISHACNREGEKLLNAAGDSGIIIALDQSGRKVTSEELASLIKKWEIHGNNRIIFLIGGPHGLSEDIRKKAHILLSLSDMTFTHQMARLIILEQVYRAFTIIKGLPYHK
jgi:23S rRNA (pseudouridine1915-N3)-methyltransferase